MIVDSVPLNTSRAGVFFLPLLGLAAFGFDLLLRKLPSRGSRTLACAVLAVAVCAPMLRFAREYFGPSYAAQIAPSFYPDMASALSASQRIAGATLPIYMSAWIPLNYVDVLYYDKVDPAQFQHSGATWKDPDFGQFHFLFRSVSTLPHPFVYLAPVPDHPICPTPRDTRIMGELQVGLCP